METHLFDEGEEDEEERPVDPGVDALGVGGVRGEGGDARPLEHGGDEGDDGDEDAHAGLILVQPKDDPGHQHQQAQRQVGVHQVVVDLSLEQELGLDAAVLACVTKIKRTFKIIEFMYVLVSLEHRQLITKLA